MPSGRTSPTFESNNGIGELSGSVVVDAPKRSDRAIEYEKRVGGLLNGAMKGLAEKESTVPDAAAIILLGPAFASKLGDLADEDDKVRKALDFVTSGTGNPYIALAFAALPLAAQILRNHESDTPVKVAVKVPFSKRRLQVPFKLKLKNPFLRGMTNEPNALANSVFSDPRIAEALTQQGVDLAWGR